MKVTNKTQQMVAEILYVTNKTLQVTNASLQIMVGALQGTVWLYNVIEESHLLAEAM